ncbi:diaminopimelate decarboxylase, partial [Staphylococcus aureus]
NYADLTIQCEWDNFGERFKSLSVEQEMECVTLNFECGRFFLAHIGDYVTEVVVIKNVHGVCYVILRVGSQHFRLPVSCQHNDLFDINLYKDNPFSFENLSIARQDTT